MQAREKYSQRFNTKEFVLSLYTSESAFTTTELSTTVDLNSNSGTRYSKIFSISCSYL